MRKTSALLLSALCLSLASCSNHKWLGNATMGSGIIVSETRNVSQFNRVSLSGPGCLLIVQGDQEDLKVEADNNLLPLLKSEVTDGELKIGPDHGNLWPTKPIRYRVRLKNLKELHLSGDVSVESEPLRADQLRLVISGSSKIRMPALEAANLEVQINGSGEINLKGKATQQKINITGSGDYYAGECEGEDVTVKISGSGTARLWATRSVDADVSGSGEVRYFNTPQVTSHVLGSGSVRSLGRK